MKRQDFKLLRVCYHVTEKAPNGQKINGQLVYIEPGLKTPWNDAKALGQKEIEKATGKKPNYLDLRASLYERAHLYEYPGRHKPLSWSEIEQEERVKNGISQFPEEEGKSLSDLTDAAGKLGKAGNDSGGAVEDFLKAVPAPKDYEPNVIERANKKALRVLFWVFLVISLLAGFLLVSSSVNAQAPSSFAVNPGDGYVTEMKYVIDDEMFIFRPGAENSNVFFNDGHIGAVVNDTLHFNFHFNSPRVKVDGVTYFDAEVSVIHRTTESRRTFQDGNLGIKESGQTAVLTVYFGKENSVSFSIIHTL